MDIEGFLNDLIISYYKVINYQFKINEIKINDIKEVYKLLNKSGYFRGEKNSKWSFLASIYRNGILKGEINYTKLKEYYYKQNKKVEDFSVSGYYLLSLMQHYGYGSPLIDFSTDPCVALYFALDSLKNEKINDDIAIYHVIPKNDDHIITSIDVADRIIMGLNVSTNNVINDFKNKMDEYTPNAYIIDIKTNTRMLLQNGVFMFMNNFKIYRDTYGLKKIKENFIINKYIISYCILNENIESIRKKLNKYKGIEEADKIIIKNR